METDPAESLTLFFNQMVVVERGVGTRTPATQSKLLGAPRSPLRAQARVTGAIQTIAMRRCGRLTSSMSP